MAPRGKTPLQCDAVKVNEWAQEAYKRGAAIFDVNDLFRNHSEGELMKDFLEVNKYEKTACPCFVLVLQLTCECQT